MDNIQYLNEFNKIINSILDLLLKKFENNDINNQNNINKNFRNNKSLSQTQNMRRGNFNINSEINLNYYSILSNSNNHLISDKKILLI